MTYLDEVEPPALIEIDVVHIDPGRPGQWSVKINAKERFGIDDFELNDIGSSVEALGIVHAWLDSEMKL